LQTVVYDLFSFNLLAYVHKCLIKHCLSEIASQMKPNSKAINQTKMSSNYGDMLILDIFCDKLISELYELKDSIASYKGSLTNLNEHARNRELLVELFDSPKINDKRLKYIKKNLVSVLS